MGEHRLRYKNVNRYILNRALRDFAGGIEAGAIVLDIGAGSGHYRDYFTGRRYVAVDMGLEQLTYKGLDVAGDILALPFRDSVADYAVCVEVLEHVYERREFLGELRRVLKDGGRILLSVPLCIGEHMRPYDYFRYTRFGLERVLSQGGFKLITMQQRGGYFVFLAYHVRRFPEYLVSSANIPGWIRKVLLRLFSPVFTYIIPFFLHCLDGLDGKSDITLGYTCILEKGQSARMP